MKKITLSIPYEILKNSHRDIRETQLDHNKIRIHRAISWLNEFDQIKELDMMFVRLWIAFNAAYAGDFGEEQSERVKLNQFLGKIVESDSEGKIKKLLLNKYTGSIRTLVDNKFAFEAFWRAVRTYDSSERWKVAFDIQKREAFSALMTGDIKRLLEIVFDRIYTLRNQIIHGGATFASTLNREQLEDACQILADLIPLMISIMIKHSDIDFGEINYPVI